MTHRDISHTMVLSSAGKGILLYRLEFYQSAQGRIPVADFLDSLDTKMQAKMVGLLEILEEKGSELRLPYSRSLGDGIFELRCKQGSNISRILYFFYFGQHIIITNGFVKKSQQTPAGEIQLAKKRRDDWIKRNARAKR